MAHQPFKSPPRQLTQFNDQRVIVPNPLPRDDDDNKSSLMRLLPIVFMVVLVGGMIAWVMINAASGRQMLSPYMMMMPLLMLGSVGFMFVGGPGGGPLGKLNLERVDYFLQLREQRKTARMHQEQIHALQASCYPHPETLLSRCGSTTMWQVTPSANVPKSASADEPQALRPWLSCRLGVGLAKVVPEIRPEPDQLIGEKLEPVTAGSFRRFLRTQKFVVNCPIGLSLTEHPIYGFRGDADAVVSLARAMIVSLAYNHSPYDITIGLVCENPDRDWDWLKWLPHTQNRMRVDAAGTARFVWRSLAEFESEWATTDEGRAHRMVVFVDLPDHDALLPRPFVSDDTTLVLLRTKHPESLSSVDARWHVNAQHEFSTSAQKNLCRADALSATKARLIAQQMSKYRPPNWDANLARVDDDGVKTFLDVFNANNIETYDPRPMWEAHEHDSHFIVDLGIGGDSKALDAESTTKVGDIVQLDLGEASVGGAGLHGCIQGITGSGKSYLLRVFVLGLCMRYSPSKVNIILADFKVGTFAWFEKLPHVVANITNLKKEDQTEFVDRLKEVIEGEILIRELRLKDYDCEDIVEYRRKRAKRPEKYPPWPELFIFVDEFFEYMNTHKQDLKLITRTGAVGRALGMHIVPSSQYIDGGLLGDSMEHFTFGISLKTSSGSRSRTVLKNCEAAKDLPMGMGAAILSRYPQAELAKFVGFNVGEPYVTAPTSNQGGIDYGAASSLLRKFALSNHSIKERQIDAPTEEIDPDDFPMIKNVLIDRLAQFDAVKAVPMWLPTLREPMTYANITVEQPHPVRLQFRIGDIDAPRLHQRLPYVITPEGAQAHIRIIGHQQSGRSTVVQAITAAAAKSYPPRYCSFYLIDYGGSKLAEIANMPNVGGYARKTDTEKIDRFIGEFRRIIAVREREFASRDVSNIDDYFTHRAANPSMDDPYGHMFLVIDGFPTYIADRVAEAANQGEDIKAKFLWFVTEATRYGLHLVVTADSLNRIPMQMQSSFGTTIQLALDVEEAKQAIMPTPELKAMVRSIPRDQPGRCVDMRRGLHARILVPQNEPIAPIEVRDEIPVFDRYANYGSGVKALCATLTRQWAEQRAIAIEPAPPLIDHSIMWNVYRDHVTRYPPQIVDGQRTAMRIHMPLGISTADLSVVTIPDKISPNLIALGDTRSGKTTLLRGLISSIINQFSSSEAQIVIIENQYDLLAEVQKLKELGYLLAYGDTKTTVPEAVQKISDMIAPRAPTDATQLSASAIRHRSWYQGPELFVLIDGVTAYSGASYSMSPLDPLNALMTERHDLGMHVYVTGNAQGFASARMYNQMYKALAETLAPTLLFSGPVGEGTLWPGTGIKFAPRRPGLAALVNPDTMRPEVIQTPYAQRWDEE